MYENLEELKKELARTAVLSSEFKSNIIDMALCLAREAFKAGLDEGNAKYQATRSALVEISDRIDELETENHDPVPFEEVRALQEIASGKLTKYQ